MWRLGCRRLLSLIPRGLTESTPKVNFMLPVLGITHWMLASMFSHFFLLCDTHKNTRGECSSLFPSSHHSPHFLPTSPNTSYTTLAFLLFLLFLL